MRDLDESYPCDCHFVRTGNSHHMERCAEGQRLWDGFMKAAHELQVFQPECAMEQARVLAVEAEKVYYGHTGRSVPGAPPEEMR